MKKLFLIIFLVIFSLNVLGLTVYPNGDYNATNLDYVFDSIGLSYSDGFITVDANARIETTPTNLPIFGNSIPMKTVKSQVSGSSFRANQGVTLNSIVLGFDENVNISILMHRICICNCGNKYG